MPVFSKKNKRIMINLVFVFFFAFLLLVFYSIYQAKNPKVQMATDADTIVLSTKIALLPKNSQPSLAYEKLINKKYITKNEFNDVDKMVGDYLANLPKKEKSNQNNPKQISKLDHAKANLQAFDEIGYLIVPKEKIPEVRDEMLKTIHRLELEEKNK